MHGNNDIKFVPVKITECSAPAAMSTILFPSRPGTFSRIVSVESVQRITQLISSNRSSSTMINCSSLPPLNLVGRIQFPF